MWEESVEKGKSKEREFARLLTNPIFASKEEDIHEHWDVMDNMGIKYDVKGMKKYRRSDPEPTDRLHWIELRNVNGDDGWLYGEADVIVFETRKWWVMVNREDLSQFVDGFLEGGYPRPKPEPYKLYQREGRKDLLTLVPTVDLLSIASNLLEKK